MTAALRHPAVRANPAEPCPFCGSGGAALATVAKPRQTRRNVTRARHNYRPCDCRFCEAGRRAPHSVALMVANIDYRGGNCITSGTRYAQAAEVSPAYQAHLDAGEVAVPDVAAGGYRWEKKGETAA